MQELASSPLFEMRCVSFARWCWERAWRGSRSSIMRPPSIDIASSPLWADKLPSVGVQPHFPTDVSFRDQTHSRRHSNFLTERPAEMTADGGRGRRGDRPFKRRRV